MRRPLHFLTRDLAMFLLGAGGFVHELALHVGPERPTVLLLCGALMGLPVFLRKDEKDKQ